MSQSAYLTGAGGFSGIVPSNLPTNTRAVKDANYIVETALPSAPGTVNGTALDLGDVVSGIPYATTETINLQVLSPALTNAMLGSGYTLTYTIQDSADNSSFTAISTLASQVLTGAGAGAVATTYTFKLPPATRRYVRLSALAGSSTDDMSTLKATLQLAF